MYTSMYYVLTYFAGSFGRYNVHAKIFRWLMTMYPIITALTGFQFTNLLPYILQVVPTVTGYYTMPGFLSPQLKPQKPLTTTACLTPPLVLCTLLSIIQTQTKNSGPWKVCYSTIDQKLPNIHITKSVTQGHYSVPPYIQQEVQQHICLPDSNWLAPNSQAYFHSPSHPWSCWSEQFSSWYSLPGTPGVG
ncbi:hypothetical protein DSO57_1020293 [Entomophthora muscae]|uniref:Uncharacterized protein n=1 Tax=Entomophthora muscae TaxID=34485 RepID=A0ACC2RUT0_9FUNG|nr:hypothetical protein DSO57_1020293 [Entomophthora muscae]